MPVVDAVEYVDHDGAREVITEDLPVDAEAAGPLMEVEPEIRDGDLVLFEPKAEPAEGNIVTPLINGTGDR